MTLSANDPIDLLTDNTGDLVVDTDLSWATGITAISQLCRVAMLQFTEEWFLNLDVGIPWFQQILGQKPIVAQRAAELYVRGALLAVTGVASVYRLDVSYTSAIRTMQITWQVTTAFGVTPVDTIALATGGV